MKIMDEKTTPTEEEVPDKDDLASKDDLAPEAIEAGKRRQRINALTLGMVLAFTMILPARYKPFALALFLIPVISEIWEKRRQAGHQSGMPQQDQGYYDPSRDHAPAHDPYEIEPKDPKKDPRRYKPIG
ncbi:MAG TPA: hypothetical protein VLL97_02910 [Acidobacteriota bacterium]|nr:hypothetical protein [Acidobacteriota bacterium]